MSRTSPEVPREFKMPGLLWKRGMPDEPGDWLWIRLWGCSCGCLHKVGHVQAWWTADYDSPAGDPGVYRVDVGGRELIVYDSRVYYTVGEEPGVSNRKVGPSPYGLLEDEHGNPDWSWVAKFEVPPGDDYFLDPGPDPSSSPPAAVATSPAK
jgi:hypothetical protein